MKIWHVFAVAFTVAMALAVVPPVQAASPNVVVNWGDPLFAIAARNGVNVWLQQQEGVSRIRQR